MSDKYAVVGNPVDHSLSPEIHARFAAQTGEDIHYGKLFAEKGAFTKAVARFLTEDGGKGLNITLPFKGEAFDFVDELSAEAREAKAVNTIVLGADGVRRGHNTDGSGLVRDLEHNCRVRIGGRRVLLLGAGGAARGVLGPLLRREPARLTVANRTPEKAAAVVDQFKTIGAAKACSFADIDADFDLIINATSAGLDNETPDINPQVLGADCLCYDLLYSLDAPTPFVDWAQGHGARAVDGFGMLIEQAAESFHLWRGIKPVTAPLFAHYGRTASE